MIPIKSKADNYDWVQESLPYKDTLKNPANSQLSRKLSRFTTFDIQNMSSFSNFQTLLDQQVGTLPKHPHLPFPSGT